MMVYFLPTIGTEILIVQLPEFVSIKYFNLKVYIFKES